MFESTRRDPAHSIVSYTRFAFWLLVAVMVLADTWMILNNAPNQVITAMVLVMFAALWSLGWVFLIGGYGSNFVYRKAVRGAVVRFAIGGVLTSLILLPYGMVSWLSLGLPLLVFALVLGASGSWFIYDEYLVVEGARTSIIMRFADRTMSPTALVCKACLTVQPPESRLSLEPKNERCWRCAKRLDRDSTYSVTWR